LGTQRLSQPPAASAAAEKPSPSSSVPSKGSGPTLVDAIEERKPRRERNAQETKRRILKAAEAEFAAKGFDGARLAAIARASGTQQALIHHYFEDKEGLHRDVLRAGLDTMAAGVWGLVERMEVSARVATQKRTEQEIREITEAFVDLMLEFFAQNGSFLDILRHESQRGELAAKIVTQSVKPVFEAIVGKLDEMKARGEVRSDVDARHLIVHAVGMTAFPFQEAPFVRAIWNMTTDASYLEVRREELVRTILARILP